MVPWQLLSDWILFGTSIWFLGKPLRTFTAQGVLLLLHAFGSLPHLMAVNGSSIHPTLHKLLNIQPAIQPLNFHRVSKSPLVSVQFFTSLSVSVRLSTNPAQSLSACPTLNQLLSVSLTVHQPCIQTSNKIHTSLDGKLRNLHQLYGYTVGILILALQCHGNHASLFDFYQPDTHKARVPLVLRLLYVFCIHLFVCWLFVHPHLSCAQ